MTSSTHNPPDDVSFELSPVFYDQLVDWPRRLKREGPFFRRVFDTHGVRSVLDVACGTGRHAALFASWGLDVRGVDASPAMVAHCRQAHGQSPRLRWAVARMESLQADDRRFDAVLCLGNSLALLPDARSVAGTIERLARALTGRGIVVVQVLNLWRLPDGPIVWQKARHVTTQGASWCVVKGVHRCGDSGFVDVAEVRLDEVDNVARCRSTPLLYLPEHALREAFAAAGFEAVACHGDHAFAPFDQDRSADLIAVASRSSEARP